MLAEHCAGIWACLCSCPSPDELLQRSECGLLGPGSARSVWTMAAEQYFLAAEAELDDGKDKAILWWGCAANMCRAGATKGGSYTLGELRTAIAHARRQLDPRSGAAWRR